MPTGTPSLDNFTKNNIDTLTISLDSASFLTQVDWSNPTLEQLDAWGTMDALDSFGNLEELSDLDVKHFLGTDANTITAAVAVQFAIEMPAAVSISATATSDNTRIRGMAGSVTGATTLSAVISPERLVSSSVSIAATVSGDAIRIRTDSASASTAITATSNSNFVFVVSGSASTAVTTTAAVNGIFAMAGTPSMVTTSSITGKILGEDWKDVAAGTPIWTDLSVGSPIWSQQTVSTATWAQI
mgnify:CR=1 FL=1